MLVAISWNRWSPSAGSAGRHPWNAHSILAGLDSIKNPFACTV
jgi:hypothetical protein